MLLIYFVYNANAVVIPTFNVNAFQDDIPVETVDIWLHHTVFLYRYFQDTVKGGFFIGNYQFNSINMAFRDEDNILDQTYEKKICFDLIIKL